jgi:hypothetical protein
LISSFLKPFTSAVLITALSCSSALALSCETDVSNFEYTDDRPAIFNFGTRADVDKAYSKLAETVGSLDIYPKPTVFFTKGYDKLTQYNCSGGKCSSQDIGEGFSICVASPRSPGESCYPLAVVYNNKMYCLLYPGTGSSDVGTSDGPYIPFAGFNSK